MSNESLHAIEGRLAVPVNDNDHLRGPADAPVSLVEYGDYQCPYCGMAYPIVEDLLRQRPDTVRYAYRHFPLTNVHPYAEPAAEAAEAAGARAMFWPAHHWLFQHQDRLDPLYLLAGVDWSIRFVSDRLVDRPADLSQLIAAARRRVIDEGWQLALCLTDLPLQTARRPVVAHASMTHGVAVLSLPALGAVGVTRR